MNRSAPRYDRWKAPAQDGHRLIWPQPGELVSQTTQNAKILGAADSVLIQSVPLAELRRRLRESIGHRELDRPLIATGHQAELHHGGVWVKNVLIDALARKLGGKAFHFSVDTDEPKHLSLRWPGGSVALSDDPNLPAKAWSGLLQCPSTDHLRIVSNQFHDAARGWMFEPVIQAFFASMQKNCSSSAALPVVLSDSQHQLDVSLGLQYDAQMFSPICCSEPYLAFAHHIIARADAFAADYNASLEQFRRDNGIRTPGRPMPNLAVSPDAVEVPFWLDDLGSQTRSRAKVEIQGGSYCLRCANDDSFVFNRNADGWDAAAKLKSWLEGHRLRISPRALTLTAVLRLLLADQFVHGIGGGQYDQVLDELIWRHFKLEPPRFSVTTATLIFPDAVGVPRACLGCIEQEGHRLRHNLLGDQKRELVRAIADAPRKSIERSRLFHRMHEMQDVVATTHPALRQWNARLVEVQQKVQVEKTLFDRELFYAIQPAGRLKEMIERYRADFREA